MSHRLYRSRTDAMLGGVAGGLADYLDVDPSVIRIIWAVLGVLTGGVLVVLYVVMWIVVPQEPLRTPGPEATGSAATATASPAGNTTWERTTRAGSAAGPMIVGLILIGLGAYFLLRQYVPQIDFDRLWPIGLVALGAAFLILSMRRRAE